MSQSYTDLLIVTVVAFAAPLLVDLLPAVRLPSVVVEVVAGIVIGPSVLGWVRIDEPIDVLSSIGLAFLLFLAGLEIDLTRLRDPLSRLAGRAFLLSVVLAVVAGLGLHAIDAEGGPLFLAVVLLSTSLGVVVPVLKDQRAVSSELGQLLMVGGSLAEFGALLLLTLLFSTRQSSTLASRLFLLAAFTVAITLVATVLLRAWRSARLSSALLRLDDTSAQLRVRAALVLLIVVLALAAGLGVEAVLGAFVAGALLRAVDEDDRKNRAQFQLKLEAIGFGVVVPVFFVASGVRFDLTALTESASALALVPVCLVALLLVRAAPALLYRRRIGLRLAGAAGLLQATSLSFIVVAAHIGVEIGQLDERTGAALVAAGLVSVIAFPALALALGPWTAPGAARIAEPG